ncbi:Uncharacterised protein [Legionella beliardensis]|uniref:Uncharacterized protein n=1 Tax=Legionella beliardensis TaxID=91822 RepID=A0A378JXQ5_9GAMM|nr:hypothetical protein [Legionella beliardensis]STX55458.1 Uncharacterised protein [Legionella beliardensis]STX55530.1 Uncharacterised protein [Legionella beliardensis]
MKKILLPSQCLSIMKQPLTWAIGMSAIIGTVAGLAMSHEPSAPNPALAVSEAVINRLNELQNHLISLEAASQKPLPKLNLSALEQKIKDLSHDVAALCQFNPEALNNHFEQRLTQTEHSLSQQLNTLNHAVTDIKSTYHAIKYLPAQSLPFKVASIDSIQTIPVASIQYDYKTIPLEKGDSLAGWTLVRVDFPHQQLEFENGNKEHVLIKQEHIG